MIKPTEYIVAQLENLAANPHSQKRDKLLPPTKDRELNRVIEAVNTLTTAQRTAYENEMTYQMSRMDDIQEVMNAFLRRDFSHRAKVSENRDNWDAIALSINYFGSELEHAFKKNEEWTKTLESQVNARTNDLIEARDELEKSLEKEKISSQLKSQFVSNASHQFRTPLAVIQANAGLLNLITENYSEAKKPNLVKSCDRITEEVANMTNMMNEVLMIGKLESDKIEIHPELTDVTALCEKIAISYNEIQEDKRTIEVIPSGKKLRINLDPKLMREALSNIIQNALKYSKGRPAPEIKITYGAKKTRIEIKDYGIGIDTSKLSDLFLPFSRGENTTNIKGTGLGLSIAKNMVELNGGAIEVRSQMLKGTTFSIILPNDVNK